MTEIGAQPKVVQVLHDYKSQNNDEVGNIVFIAPTIIMIVNIILIKLKQNFETNGDVCTGHIATTIALDIFSTLHP